MITFGFTIGRAYLAAAVVIAAMLLARSQFYGWTSELVSAAAFADLVVVGMLALLYATVEKLFPSGSLLGSVNRWTHWLLVVLVFVLAGLSQALFVKTGELLNLDMLFFFLDRVSDLKDVATGAMDMDLLAIMLLGMILLALASFRFKSRTLVFGQYLALFLPIGLAIGGPLIQPVTVDNDFENAIPERVASARLYQGKYRNIGGQQRAWNASGVAEWRRGILTGMPVSSLGASALQVLAKNSAVDSIYEAPHAAHAEGARPNIIFVVLESFRYDALGAYSIIDGGAKSNTPFMDQIARQGWRVDRAYTTIPHTSKALVGIYCGTFARMETNISESLPGNLPLTCLPRLLNTVGYRTAHFQTAIGTFEDRLPFLENVGFNDRFTQESFSKEGKDWASLGYLGIDDRAMIDPAINWMETQRRQGVPFFASLLTITTHHPYVTPNRIEAVHEPAQAKKAYDDAVRYTDDWMRELFGKLKRRGLLDGTLVVITGDHGEGFAEHGAIAHNGTGYEEGMRVPLILSGPMFKQPKVVKGLRQHIDLMPTVLEATGIKYAGKLPGQSLLSDPLGHDSLVTSCFYRNYCLTHLSSDGGKVIFFYGKRGIEMYDLGSDPNERRNLYNDDTHENAFQRLEIAVRMKVAFEAVYHRQDGAVTIASDGP